MGAISWVPSKRLLPPVVGLIRQTDVVHLDGVSIEGVTIGYATGLYDNFNGLMGVGYPAIEGTDAAHEYPDFPYNLHRSALPIQWHTVYG